MAVVEVPQTLVYRGGQLNAALVLEVENFTNWKKRFMCHILGIEPQFKNIIKNGPFIPMTAGQRKPKGQWTRDEIKAANLDQQLKSLIMFVLPDDQMNSVINCLTAKSTWDDLILYHEGPSDVKQTKYNKVKAKLALLSSSASASKDSMVKNKGLIAEAYESDKEEVSSDDNEMVEVKVLMELAEENDAVSKEGPRNDEWVRISMRKCISEQIPSQKKRIQPWLSEAEGFILPNHDTGRILPAESQRNTTDPSVDVINSLVTIYDSTDESSVSPTKVNKSSSASKVHSAPAGKLKSVKIEDDPPLAIVMKELNNLKLQVSKNQSSYSRSNQSQQKTDQRTCDHAEYISTLNMSQHLKSLGRASSRSKIPRPSKRFFPPCTHCGYIDHLSNECLYYPICGLCGSYDHDTNGHNRIISLEREINPRNPQHAFKRCKVYGSSTHTTTDHYDIKWFKRGEALQAKDEALKSTKAESSNANRSKTPTKRETIFNSNKEVVMIAPGVRDVYVLDITSSAPESCFFAKAYENLNWLWHKRLAYLNFKTINKLAKQNLVIGLPSLVYSKDKPCSSCKKGKASKSQDKNKVCLLCEEILKQIPAFNFFCASLESISAIDNTWEWVEGMG
ncbi:retrovirus-related pol polyprotein from transposon TNT 1-94 [Tanacetum coccineum]